MPLLTIMNDHDLTNHPDDTAVTDQERILRSPDRQQRLKLASNPAIHPEVLMELLDEALPIEDCVSLDRILLRESLAQNPTCPDEVAELLIVDLPAYEATRPEVSSDVLRYLARSGSPLVRAAVASNVSAPQDLLTVLAHDDSPRVRRQVALNTSAPREALEALLDFVDDCEKRPDSVLEAIAIHPNATPDILNLVMDLGSARASVLAGVNPRNRYAQAMIEVVVERAYREYRALVVSGVEPMTAAAAVAGSGA